MTHIRIFILILVLFTNLNNFIQCDEFDDEVTTENIATEDKSQEKPKYVKPTVKGSHHFLETFDLESFGTKWIKSLAKKADVDEIIAKYEGEWSIESPINSALEGDKGLVLKSKAKHHAISARLLKPFDFKQNKPLVLQYEVKFQNALECGGAYVKLLSDEPSLKLDNFLDKTPYTIMFGPDKCGPDSKLHFILRHKHPLRGTFEEKHAKKTEHTDPFFNDGKTHLYTLILRPDNTYHMYIDQNELNSGSLLTDLTPPINPEKEIVDPDDKKPESWDEREKIPDPDAVKPEDWNEEEPKQMADVNAVKPDGWLDDEESTIPDPNAVKPEDWDNETDGEWEAPKIDNIKCKSAPGCGKWEIPMINNPNYKGKWKAPLIDNPNYQGKWEPRKIQNPDYFIDNEPFKSIVSFSAIGLELWSMTNEILFDNFLITDDETVAQEFAKDSWAIKNLQESKSAPGDSVVDAVVNATRDKPWLWAVYLLIVLVPIILIVFFCCGKKTPTSDSKTRATDLSAKKTDAETKDDADEEEEEEEETQAAAENEEQNEQAGASNAEAEETKDENEELKKTSSNTSINKDTTTATPPASLSPRKRRNRKD